MKDLFIATNNKHKLEEINAIFKINNFNINILTPRDFDDYSDPIEDGFTYEENAYIKASYYFNKYHLPTIADDSGLSIKYFNNLPNLHSKRFLYGKNNDETNEFIVEVMKYVKDREAIFESVICFIDENSNINYFSGNNIGEIAYEIKGNEGFGYDPILYIPYMKKTEAELGNDFKNHYSHRAKAIKRFINFVKENY